MMMIDDRELEGDVGGQRTLRPYWRNYFEQTDAIVWVVDSGDRHRMGDCKEELHTLLQEDVKSIFPPAAVLSDDLPLIEARWGVPARVRKQTGYRGSANQC